MTMGVGALGHTCNSTEQPAGQGAPQDGDGGPGFVSSTMISAVPVPVTSTGGPGLSSNCGPGCFWCSRLEEDWEGHPRNPIPRWPPMVGKHSLPPGGMMWWYR